MRFIQIFILYCIFEKSGPFSAEETGIINRNAGVTALSGRREGLMLADAAGRLVTLKEYGEAVFEKLVIIAGLADRISGDKNYTDAVKYHYRMLDDRSLLPSEKIVRSMRYNNEGHAEFGLRRAEEHRKRGYAVSSDSAAELVPLPMTGRCCGFMPAGTVSCK